MNKENSDSNDWDENEDDGWDKDNWDDTEDIQQDNHIQGSGIHNTKETKSISEGFNKEVPVKNKAWDMGSVWGVFSKSFNQVIGVPNQEEEEINHVNVTEATTMEAQKPPCEDVCKDKPQSDGSGFGLSLVTGVTSLGSKVLTSGLDTLEEIGKKTMNILQENDPLLMNKRKLLGLESDRPNLSEVLQEAKKDAALLENTIKELNIEKSKKQLNFDFEFENQCGLVHLEALEILSKESEMKLQTLLDSVSGNALNELRETINIVTELMDDELDADSEGNYDCNDLKQNLLTAIADADMPIHFDDIVNNWSVSLKWITTAGINADEEDIFSKGITELATLCALEVNKLHKISELLLVKEHHSTANEVDAIVQLCKQFKIHLTGLTNRYASLFTIHAHASYEAKVKMNTLFTEMLLATTHIDKAFKLILPVLQICAI